MKKWTAVQYDVSKKLSEVQVKRVKIPAGLNLYLIINLDDEAYKRLAKDPVWLAKMQEKANSKVVPVLETLKSKVKQADEKAAKFDSKAAAIFSKDLTSFLEQQLEKAGVEMAKEVDKFFDDYKKGQKELLKFRIKSGTKITVNAIVIIGAVAATTASHGAFAPAGIVAIARGGLIITQECAKLATSADQIAKLIQGELKLLQKIMINELAAAKKSGKISQSAKEIGLGMFSAVLGIETPSLKNCEGHIAVHKVDIAKLKAESHKLGKTIHAAMDAEEKWRGKFNVAKKTLPPEKVRKVETQVGATEKTLNKLLKAVVKISEAITRGETRQTEFEKALNSMMKGLPGWVGYVQTAANLAIDIGLAVGGASTAIEQGLGALIAAEVDIGSELLDKV